TVVLTVSCVADELAATGLAIIDPNGNGVWDSGEAVTVVPAWTSNETVPFGVTGSGSNVGVPPGVVATLTDTTADYGTIPAGGTANCQAATGNCYVITGLRASGVWGDKDVEFTEQVSPSGLTQTWKLHIGPSFADVATNVFYYRAVETMLHRGVTGGCTASDYCPGGSTNRAQMAVFISRAVLGTDPPVAGSGPAGSWNCGDGLPNQFTDVPDGVFYCRHAHWMWAHNITSGCTATQYCPADLLNRAQMAVFIVKAFNLLLYGP
ncbi:MAG: hypothetical protein NZ742_11235, partial [Acidobacteria bacterium]|nr:hypothetical protein [Acidobacteriota bacterium]